MAAGGHATKEKPDVAAYIKRIQAAQELAADLPKLWGTICREELYKPEHLKGIRSLYNAGVLLKFGTTNFAAFRLSCDGTRHYGRASAEKIVGICKAFSNSIAGRSLDYNEPLTAETLPADKHDQRVEVFTRLQAIIAAIRDVFPEALVMGRKLR